MPPQGNARCRLRLASLSSGPPGTAVHCGGSRRATASGAPGGLQKVDARYVTSTWHGDAGWQACRHDGSVPCRLRQAGWSRLHRSGTLRGRCPWLSVLQDGLSPRARTYSGQLIAANIIQSRLRRSERIWRCRQESTVKPSAQPTLVRTQHLPLPAETARLLRILALAGRFFSVPACVTL